MTAIIGGSSLGLNLSSLAVLGARGQIGTAMQGRNGERVYVNAVTGDLVLQDADSQLVGLGGSLATLRTYNSQGTYTFGGDGFGWQGAPTKAIQNLGVTNGVYRLRRIDLDGSTRDYVGTDGKNYQAAPPWLDSAPDAIVINTDGTYTWTDGATQTKETYQLYGTQILLKSSADVNGNSFQYTYNASNQLTKVANADGDYVQYAYGGVNGGANDVTGVQTVLRSGTVLSQVSYKFDAQGRLYQVTVQLNPNPGLEPVTTGASATANTGGDLLTAYVTTYGYDGTSNRVASITQSDGTSLTIGYDSNGRVTSILDGVGQKTTIQYCSDTNGSYAIITDPLGQATQTLQTVVRYDANGQFTQIIGNVSNGNLGTGSTGVTQARFAYDSNEDLSTITDGLGNQVNTTYVKGNLTQQTDALGNVETRTYNGKNQLLTDTWVVSGQTRITRYVYDSTGCNLRFVISPEGRVTEYRYGPQFVPYNPNLYVPPGSRGSVIDYAAGTYDTSGLGPTAVPTEQQMSSWVTGQDRTKTQRTDLAYDYRGQLQLSVAYSTADASGYGIAGTAVATQYVYDERGFLIQTVTPDGNGITQAAYDGLGRQVWSWAKSLDGTISSKTATLYDDQNRKTSVTLANGLTTASTYDADGRLVSVVQSSGGSTLGTTQYWYDVDGRLLMTQDPTGKRSWTMYDALGRKAADVDAAGGLTEYLYNANNQVTEAIGYATALTATQLTSLVDGSGNPTTGGNPLGTGVTLASLRPATTAQDERSWNLYDADGRLTWQVDGLGYVTQTQYDGASQVLSVTKLATPIDVTKLGSGTGVALSVSGYATTTQLTETVSGSGPAATRLLTATVASVNGPSATAALTGTVAFFAGTTCLGTAALVNGVARLTVTSLPAGTQSLVAVYGGDASNPGSASSVVTDNVAATATTTTSLTLSKSQSAPGAAVTLTAQVTGSGPTGTVTFYSGTTLLGTKALADGLASLTVTTLPAGTDALKAVYGGDTANAASTSAVMTETVASLTTSTTSLTASASAAAVGVAVTLTATVTGSSPSGMVSFYSGTTLVGSAQVSSGGVAQLVTTALPAGTDQLSAVYTGDAKNSASTSAVVQVTETAQLLATTTALYVSTAQAVVGAPVVLTATVQGIDQPTGTVTFYNGTASIGTATLTNGVASLTVSTLPLGSPVLKAVYSGDPSNATSTSASVTKTIVAAPNASVTVTSAMADDLSGVVLTATVSGALTPVPTGQVVFYNGATALGTATLDGAGVATLVVAGFAVGSGLVSAVYAGDGSYTSCQGIRAVGGTPVMVALTATATAPGPVAPVLLTATVGDRGPAAPTGMVTFYNGSLAVGTAAVIDGVACLQANLVVAGTSLTAKYSGDAANNVSTSAAVSVGSASTAVATTVTLSSTATTVAQGQAFRLTATVSPPVPNGYVTFLNGQAVLGVAQITKDQLTGVWNAQLTTTLYVAGTASITAAYAGNIDSAPSRSGALAFTVTSASATPPVSTALPTESAVAYGSAPGTLVATVWGVKNVTLPNGTIAQLDDPRTLTGTVTFFQGSTLLGTVAVAYNQAILNVGSFALGKTAITAVYSGDATNGASTVGNQTLGAAPTSVTLSASASQITKGSAITLKAGVLGSSPTGTVTFYSGTTSLGTATVTSGIATLTTTALGAGTAKLTASFTDSTGKNGSSTSADVGADGTAPADVVVNVLAPPAHATQTALALSTGTSAAGTAVTLTATVTGFTPTGLVSFFLGTTLLGSASVTPSTGKATLTLANLPVGTDQLTAVYAGDANNGTSASAVATETVQKASTTTVLTRSDGQTTAGAGLVLTAMVSGTGSPTGTVTFMNGATALGTASLSGGRATLTVTNLPVTTSGSPLSLTATYNGDAANASSPSAAVSEVVLPSTTTTANGTASSIACNGALRVTVSGTGAAPTGTVTFFNGATVLGTAAVSGGAASLAGVTLPLGSLNITAAYSGDATHASSKVQWTQTVAQATTATTLKVSPGGTAANGAAVVLTAQVAGASPGGTVTFYNGTTALGTAQLTNGLAALTLSNLPVGSASLTAKYGGDTSNAVSTSTALTEKILPPPAAVALTASPTTVAQGGTLTLTATVTGASPTGQVTFVCVNTVLGTATLVNGKATLTLTNLSLGTGAKAIRAAYTGDANDGGVVSATATVTVTAGTLTTLVAQDPDDRVVTNLYDRDGLLGATIDGEGYLREFRYDAAGRVIQTIAYANAVSNFTNAASIASQVAAARANDSLAGLLPTADPVNDVNTFVSYDAAGRKVREVDGAVLSAAGEAQIEAGKTRAEVWAQYATSYLTEYAYDADGRLSRTTRYATPVGLVTSSAQLAALSPSSTAADQKVTYTYDALGRLATQTNVESSRTTYTYDSVGNITQQVVAAGTTDARTYDTQYDAQGRVTAELSAVGAAAVANGMDVSQAWAQYATTYTYDSAGRRMTSTDANGHRTLYFYDDAGRLRYTVDPTGAVVETTYDARGRVLTGGRYATLVSAAGLAGLTGGVLTSAVQSVLDTAKNTASGQNAFTRYRYDARGECVASTQDRTVFGDGVGGTTTQQFDAFGDVVATTRTVDSSTAHDIKDTRQYDRRGLLTVGVADAGDASDANATTNNTYDAFGRLTSSADPNGNLTQQAYDQLGRLVQTMDAAGAKQYTTYDAFSRVLTQVDALGNATSYAYDDVKRTVTVTLPDQMSVTVTTHNREGQTIAVKDADGNTVSCTYDADGNLSTKTAQVTDWTYDSVQKRFVSSTKQVTLVKNTYDHADLLTDTADGDAVAASRQSVSYTYDAANRLLTRTTRASSGLDVVTTYQYDAKGQQVQVTENGVITQYAFDLKGEVVTKTVDLGGLNLTTQYGYDRAGRMLTVTDARNTVTQYAYDGLGRRTQTIVDPITTGNPDGLNLVTTYSYDEKGNVVYRVDANGNATRYVYDVDDRLRYTVDAAGDVQETVYDAAGRVTKTVAYGAAISLSGLAQQACEADIAGRIQSAPAGSPDAVEFRFYDQDGRQTYAVNGAGGVTQYSYDGAGNVIARKTYYQALTGWTVGSAPTLASSGILNGLASDARDLQLETAYDELGRAVFTLDGVGAVVAQRYDASGNLIERVAYAKAIDPATAGTASAITAALVAKAVPDSAHDLHTWMYYDAANRLVFSVNGIGAITQQVYDANGRVVQQVAYARTSTSNPTVTAPATSVDDRVTLYGYDGAGRLKYTVNAVGGVTQLDYDRVGQVVKTTAYAKPTAVPTASSSAINMGTFAPTADPAGKDRYTGTVYDAAGRVVYSVDASGAVTYMRYDAAGNLIGTVAYANTITPGTAPVLQPDGSYAGTPAADPDDRTQLFAYDAANRRTYGVDAAGYVTKNVYDGAGRVISTTLYGKQTTGLTFGATAAAIQGAVGVTDHDETSSTTYDAAGRIAGTTDALGYAEAYTYSGAGEKLSYRNKNPNQNQATWRYDYDAAGRLVTETSPVVSITTVSPNANGDLVASTPVSESVVTKTTYDALGNVLSRTEAAERPATQQRVTLFGYDAAGRQVTTTYPSVPVYTQESAAAMAANGASGLAVRTDAVPSTPLTNTVYYNAFGEAVENMDPGGNLSVKTYDGLGRITYEVDALGYVTGYDRGTATNVFGSTTTLTRYATHITPPTFPALTTADVARQLATSGQDRTITTQYDAMDRAVQVQLPQVWINDGDGTAGYSASPTTLTTYDAFGQAVQVAALATGASTSSQTWAYTTHYFDKRGQETGTVDALGYVTKQTYDSTGNLTSRTEYANQASGWTPASPPAAVPTPVTSADDRKTTWSYDKDNRKTSETRVNVEYTSAANLPSDPQLALAQLATSMRGNLTTTYGYDALGNQTSVTDALGNATYTCYDALGRTMAVAAPSRTSTVNGQALTPLTTFARDALGNVVLKTEYANGGGASNAFLPANPVSGLDRTTLTQFDLRGNAIEMTDANGVSHFMSYDRLGRLAKGWQGVAGNDGVVHTLYTAFAYDALGRQTAIYSPASTSVVQNGTIAVVTQNVAGTVVTTMVYNGFGEMTQRYTLAPGQTLDPQATEDWEYDVAGRMWRTDSGDGNAKISVYDLLGQETAQISSAGNTSTLAATCASAAQADQAGSNGLRRTDRYYDLLGRARTLTLPLRQDATDTAAYRPVVYQNFDRWGNIVTQSDVRNSAWVTTFYYNANNQEIRQIQPDGNGVQGQGPITYLYYDALGEQVAIRDANGNVNGKLWDGGGQVAQEIHADADTGVWSPNHYGGVVVHAYDAFGDQVRLTDAMGYLTSYAYDNLGHNVAITSDPVAVYKPDLNADGSLHADDSIIRVGTQQLTTSMVYDEAGRKLSETDPLGEQTQYTYDLRGNVIATTKPMGGVERTAFDAYGDKVGSLDADNSLATWRYDAFGHLQQHTDIGGASYSYGYDKAQQLVLQTNTRGQRIAYTYDDAGQMVSIQDDDNTAGASYTQKTLYAYNAAGKHVLEQMVQGAYGGQTPGTTYQNQRLAYDTLGRLAQVDAMDGVSVHYDYDAVGNRLHQRTTFNTETAGQVADYGYGIADYDIYGGPIYGNNAFLGTHTVYSTVAHTLDYWNAFDQMNRQIMADGATNRDPTDYANVTEAQGHLLRYDKNGNRVMDVSWGRYVAPTVPGSWIGPTGYGGFAPSPGGPSYDLRVGPTVQYYDYDHLNRLVSAKMAGYDTAGFTLPEDQALTLDTRSYDAASRVLEVGPNEALPHDYLWALSNDYVANADGARRRFFFYDADGRTTFNHVEDPRGNWLNNTSYTQQVVTGRDPIYGSTGTIIGYKTNYGQVSGYDAAGNLVHYWTDDHDNGYGYYTTDLKELESYETGSTSASQVFDGSTPVGNTQQSYDANGYLTGVTDSQHSANNRSFVNDVAGHIVAKTQQGHILRQLVVENNVVAVYGEGTDPVRPTTDAQGNPVYTSQADFDLNYEPITNTFPTAAVGVYAVTTGDTLQSIAQSAYGDASFWYLIADANGLHSDSDLRVGQSLTIPTRPAGSLNSSQTYKPYDPSRIIGDTTPTLPPPGPGACKTLALVVVIIVTIIVTIYTCGATAELLVAECGALGAEAVGTAIVAGAVGAAVGALAGQATANLLGLQHGFDFEAVGTAALAGAVGGGIAAGFAGASAGTANPLVHAASRVASAAVSDAANQGLATWFHNQDHFSWAQVAGAAVGSATAVLIDGSSKLDFDNKPVPNNVYTNAAKGVVSGMTSALVSGRGPSMAAIVADAFGNAIGNSLAERKRSDIERLYDDLDLQRQQEAADAAEARAKWGASPVARMMAEAYQDPASPGLSPIARLMAYGTRAAGVVAAGAAQEAAPAGSSLDLRPDIARYGDPDAWDRTGGHYYAVQNGDVLSRLGGGMTGAGAIGLFNNLENGNIRPGQTLWIPAEGTYNADVAYERGAAIYAADNKSTPTAGEDDAWLTDSRGMRLNGLGLDLATSGPDPAAGAEVHSAGRALGAGPEGSRSAWSGALGKLLRFDMGVARAGAEYAASMMISVTPGLRELFDFKENVRLIPAMSAAYRDGGGGWTGALEMGFVFSPTLNAIADGYRENGVLGAVNKFNPFSNMLFAGSDAVEELKNGNYEGAGYDAVRTARSAGETVLFAYGFEQTLASGASALRGPALTDPPISRALASVEGDAAADGSVLFGQRRAGPNFSNKEGVPAFLKGRPISDVAADLRAGVLHPDQLPVEAFDYNGQLVSANTRTLGALSEAGMVPTKVNIIEPTPALLRRLTETPLIPDAPLPGPRLPITPTMVDPTVLRVITIPGVSP